MGFLDKAKEAADRAVASAQQMAQQGQASYVGYQASKSEGELLRALGEAFYDQQRRGGDASAVAAAMAAVDEHHRAAAAEPGQGSDAAPSAPAAPAAQAGPVPPPGPPTAPAVPPTQSAPAPSFTLDDL